MFKLQWLSVLQGERDAEQRPSSTSANDMENSRGNILVNGLRELTPLRGDFHLHL